MWLYDYITDKDNPYRSAPFVQICHMAYVDNAPLWYYPWHDHEDCFEVSVLISGEGELYVHETPFHIRAGMVTVIPPGTPHRYQNDNSPMEYYTIRFSSEDPNGELFSFFRDLGPSMTDAANYMEYLTQGFRMLLTIHQGNGGVADSMFQTVALALLQWIRYLFGHETLTLRIGDQYGVADVLEYIEKNKEKKITLDSLSYQFGISASQLNRIFRKAYQTTPINYLITCRVTYATEYLLKSNLSVAEIGERVGYENPNHFINMFTQRIGCTPDEYRRNNGKIPLEHKDEE